ncbi:13082_t:CDS:2 [Entrophospora sp. SA101]|nr:13082_t:CDS:2 [Entrophospora sp. SA101]CAJ0828444.1 11155_t:CDS:2 [Entrophospora sp. SA101]
MNGKYLYNILNKILDSNEINELALLPYKSLDLSSEHYPFILLEQNLGLPLEHIANIFKYAHEQFMKNKHNIINIENNRNVNEEESDYQEIIKTLKESSRCMILINPECYTVINTRKKLILNKLIDPEYELKLIDLILTFPKHTKGSIIWHHRKWTILQIQSLQSFSSPNGYFLSKKNLTHEIKIIQHVLNLYPKNYFSWLHRYWMLEQLESMATVAAVPSLFNNNKDKEEEERLRFYNEFLSQELKNVKNWINLNLSDYSGLNYLQNLLIKIIKNLHCNNQKEEGDGNSDENSTIKNNLFGFSRMNLFELLSLQKNQENQKGNNLESNVIIRKLMVKEFKFIKRLILRYFGYEKENEMNEDDADIEVINCSPTFDNELNFSNHCVNKINNMLSNNLLEGNKNHDDEEFIAVGKGLDNGIVKQLTKQKCFALNYQLWIFELYCKPIDDEQVRSLINELAELIPETNYYHSLLTRKKAMSDS